MPTQRWPPFPNSILLCEPLRTALLLRLGHGQSHVRERHGAAPRERRCRPHHGQSPNSTGPVFSRRASGSRSRGHGLQAAGRQRPPGICRGVPHQRPVAGGLCEPSRGYSLRAPPPLTPEEGDVAPWPPEPGSRASPPAVPGASASLGAPHGLRPLRGSPGPVRLPSASTGAVPYRPRRWMDSCGPRSQSWLHASCKGQFAVHHSAALTGDQGPGAVVDAASWRTATKRSA